MKAGRRMILHTDLTVFETQLEKKNPFCIAQKEMWAENTAHHSFTTHLGEMCSEIFSFEHWDLFQKKIIFIN